MIERMLANTLLVLSAAMLVMVIDSRFCKCSRQLLWAQGLAAIIYGDEASTIKDIIDALAPNDKDKASVVNFLLATADHQANLTDTEFRKVQHEVQDLVTGHFDTRINHSGTLHR